MEILVQVLSTLYHSSCFLGSCLPPFFSEAQQQQEVLRNFTAKEKKRNDKRLSRMNVDYGQYFIFAKVFKQSFLLILGNRVYFL